MDSGEGNSLRLPSESIHNYSEKLPKEMVEYLHAILDVNPYPDNFYFTRLASALKLDFQRLVRWFVRARAHHWKAGSEILYIRCI